MMGNRAGRIAAGLLLAISTASAACGAPDSDEAILRVGVEFVPVWGPDTTRIFTEEGFEASLAAEIGRRLGRPVELEKIPAAEQDAALEAGRVDLVIGREALSSTRFDANAPGSFAPGPSFRVLPTGYRSGLSVAMPTFTTVREWEDLAGKTVCVSEANIRGRQLAQSLGASLRVRRAPAEALIDVRTGVCDASIHDDRSLSLLLASDEWRKFSATLPEAALSALVVAVPAKDADLAGAVEEALADITRGEDWAKKEAQWASDVAFDVYLNQVGNDCH
ncbi:transporter substrate-binding domain-containing protein [Rhizobiaceae bacterium BDR2-2]|uniref:Transporter substrate-binding domain-containing protein n=1 Tax=Ectorhizobium quercum TaxID=2965071 RepID=A0AAE3N545_9HYPH|nr:transporter substrate-binding domain-containing protein [Ectorhizobium quercum]MCX8999869.1 transporter substrate-binding domain-containing protein [Ectorhizobium quercum]